MDNGNITKVTQQQRQYYYTYTHLGGMLSDGRSVTNGARCAGCMNSSETVDTEEEFLVVSICVLEILLVLLILRCLDHGTQYASHAPIYRLTRRYRTICVL